MALLEVEDVHARYGAIEALRGVSLTVEDGEIVTLIGSNGAGKSTTLRAISGLTPASGGRIAFAGEDITRAPTEYIVGRGIAMAPEGRHVFPRMTVRENLDLGAHRRRGPEITEDLDRVFSLFPRLEERERQKAGMMSGGEQQMLAIGRALMTDPQILLVDEMSAGLAPVTAQLLVESLRTIHRQLGVSMLLVEQSPHLIEDLVDRVYVLDRGQITAAGTVADIGGSEGLAAVYLSAH